MTGGEVALLDPRQRQPAALTLTFLHQVLVAPLRHLALVQEFLETKDPSEKLASRLNTVEPPLGESSRAMSSKWLLFN